MTVVGSELDPTSATTKAPRAGRPDPLAQLPAWARLSVYAAILVLILTIAEQATDQTRLTSANTWASALNLAVPIALAGLGGLWAERAGVVNIGLEGMMILGTWMGAWGCIEFGPWPGVALGVLGGALGGLLHAVATVGFGVDHIVSGVAINILGLGVTQFANLEMFDSTNQSPRIPDNVAEVSVPGINDVIGDVTGNLTNSSVLVWMVVSLVALVAVGFLLSPRRGGADSGPFGLATTTAARIRTVAMVVLGVVALMCLIEVAPYLDDQERFFISELGRIVLGLTQDLSLIVVMGILAFPLSAFVLWRTKFGLRLRSVGEDPLAAESLGVNVYLMKYVGVIMSGALAGLGGVALVYVFAGQFRVGQTNGRGYIGLAAMIFGNWRPAGLAMGAGLFGFTDSLSLQSGETTRTLLVVVALLAALLALRGLITGKWRAAIVAADRGRRVVPLLHDHRRDPERDRHLPPPPHHPPRADLRIAAAATTGGRRPAVPTRRVGLGRGRRGRHRLGAAARRGPGHGGARLRPLLRGAGRRGRPRRRRPDRHRLQRRERQPGPHHLRRERRRLGAGGHRRRAAGGPRRGGRRRPVPGSVRALPPGAVGVRRPGHARPHRRRHDHPRRSAARRLRTVRPRRPPRRPSGLTPPHPSGRR